MDIKRLKSQFAKRGYAVEDKHFSDIDFRSENYKGQYVLYQSSEDPDLRYKDYIEDVLLGLSIQGAKLIPNFELFRAHHNKVFMEILRDLNNEKTIKNIQSKSFGTAEEYSSSAAFKKAPVVIKPSAGARSTSVKLIDSTRKRASYPKKVARSMSAENIRHAVKNFVKGKGFVPTSNYRKKFTVQPFIPGLEGDYKVLIYNDKYYVRYRTNRPNDFRASGSGIKEYPETLPNGLLDYAHKVFRAFSSPYASLDIAEKDGQFFLLEFQFISFGQRTLEESKDFFRKEKEKWKRVAEKPDLEREIAQSVASFIKSQSAS